MTEGSKRECEERALDALLVSTLRRVEKDDDLIEPEKLPQLTEEEKSAMNALGADFIDRILAGERPIQPLTPEGVPGPRERNRSPSAAPGPVSRLKKGGPVPANTGA